VPLLRRPRSRQAIQVTEVPVAVRARTSGEQIVVTFQKKEDFRTILQQSLRTARF